MQSESRPLSELRKIMRIFPQRLINVEVQSKPDIESVSEIMDAIGEVEEKLKEQGRVLVRYSGTQPLCRIMVEAPTPEETRVRIRFDSLSKSCQDQTKIDLRDFKKKSFQFPLNPN